MPDCYSRKPNATGLSQYAHMMITYDVVTNSQQFVFIIMGNNLCGPEEAYEQPQMEVAQEVLQILNDFPETQRNSMFRGITTRYSDLSVLNQDSNRYIFLLKIDGHETRVVIPVINELSHRALVQNYKLAIGKEMIIDPFDERLECVLVPVRNELEQKQYSMRIVPFRGYNSIAFKRVIEQVWIYKNIAKRQDRMSEDPKSLFLMLEDCFIYGVDADQQAVVLLYQKIQGSLLLAADYRRKACQPWKTGQRLKILRDMVKGCSLLQEIGVAHRDVRASNIFYSSKQRRYLLGGFGCSRFIKQEDEEDLLTVCGIETQVEDKLRQLISTKQNVGLFKVNTSLYYQLRVLNRLLDSRRIADEISISQFQQSVFINIQNMLTNSQPLQDILRAIQAGLRVADRTREFQLSDEIAHKSFKLLPFRIRDLCERYIFSIYSRLGYQMEFSEMAHKMIEKNNIEGNPYGNAKILKELGLFYQKHGTGGTQYLLNSCVLFCKEAQIQIEKGLYEDALLDVEQGQDVYIHLSSKAGQFSMSMIELKRLRTELRARTLLDVGEQRLEKEKTQVMQLMSKTLELAAQQNLPIEKQMRMFLTWGIVHRECGDRAAAGERFMNGLAVCENEGSFESHSTAILMKSHFLYELSVMKLDVLQEQHDPLVTPDKQNYSPPDLPKLIENWLLQSLQVREKESTRAYQAVQCYVALGRIYMMQSQFLQAKVQFKRALVRLLDMQKSEKILYEKIVEAHYDLGSVNYRLQDYQESVDHYRQAIVMLQENNGDQYWTNVIAGNLGLAYLRAGLKERGRSLLQKSKEAIRSEHGAQHYDFLFLASQEQVINQALKNSQDE